MNTTIEFEFNGQTYYLLMNAAALFDCYDKFGNDILDSIMGTSRRSFNSMVWVLAKLSQQGELLRRYQGEDHSKAINIEDATRTMSPVDAGRARKAILEAYKAGFAREVEKENEEVDLGLIELQKKTESGSRKHSFLTGLRNFFRYLFGNHS